MPDKSDSRMYDAAAFSTFSQVAQSRGCTAVEDGSR